MIHTPFIQKIYMLLLTTLKQGVVPGLKLGLVLFLHKDVHFRPQGFCHGVLVRAKTSDPVVAFTTFVKKEYRILDPDSITTILDLGGNVGYSAVYFAHHYPKARIVVLEPQKDNYSLLCKNSEKYPNIIPLNAGVWWRKANLEVLNPKAASWAFKFAEVAQGGSPCMTMDQLIDEYGSGGAIMVKMDIEGAEKAIFENAHAWIAKVAVIQLEIHRCWKSIFDQLIAYDYNVSISGENTIIELNHRIRQTGPGVS